MARTTITLPPGTVVPDHIAMVLDGNRRWARSRGLNTLEGHKAGFEAGMKIAEASRDWGVHTFTVYGFSTENWDRSASEIKYLMALYRKMLDEIRKKSHRDEIRFVHLGRNDRFPKELVAYFKNLEDETRHYTKHVFNVALDYGGRDEIIRATKKIIADKVPEGKIDEKLFASYLDTGDQPYPYVDLFIRTSGEQRTSGFLPWQSHYAEFYWEIDHLPDMTPQKLANIIIDYSRRRRRFGGNDSVEHLSFDPKVTAKLEIAWWRLKKVPAGMRLRDYAVKHIKEQYGLSKDLAKDAAIYFAEALLNEEGEKWDKAAGKLKKFYKLIKGELKLAFEPKIVASLEVKMHQEKGENEETTREYLAETYRISLFQAAKAAHLRVLAAVERNLALATGGEAHWQKAEDYLQKFYRALKERVA